MNTLAATIPVAAFTLVYLYFSPAVQDYYTKLARRAAQWSEVREWLDTPERRHRGV